MKSFGVAFVCLFLWANYELAFAVEVQPMRLELTVAADEPTQGNLEITNRAPRAVDVQIGSGPYRFLQPRLTLPSAQTWFSFEPAHFTLGPGASSKVTYSITPPSNVIQDTAGEYLAAILIDELPAQRPPNSETHTSSITVVPRFAIPVYLKIKGRELIQVEIAAVTVKESPSGYYSPQPDPSRRLLRVETTLENRGTVHVRPTGTVMILQKGGIVSANPLGKALPLLPTDTLHLPTLLPLPAPGSYTAVVTVEAKPGQLLQKQASFEITPEGELR